MEFSESVSILLRALFTLAFISLVTYLLSKFVLPKLSTRLNGKGVIRLIERKQIDNKKSLLAVEFCDKGFLIGVGENGFQLIAEVEKDAVTKKEAFELELQNSPQVFSLEGFSMLKLKNYLRGAKK